MPAPIETRVSIFGAPHITPFVPLIKNFLLINRIIPERTSSTAAIIIGEVLGELILGKRLNFIGRLLFTAVGAIIYFVVIQVVLWLGLSSQNTKLFSAITVAVFLAVPYLKAQSKTSFKRAAKRGVAEDAGA